MEKQLHQQELVRLRALLVSRYIARTATVTQIRQQCLSNIVRWRSQGSDSILWDEWVKLMIGGKDELVIDAMTNDDVKLWREMHRAPAYFGMLCPEVREYIYSFPVTDLPTIEDISRFDQVQKEFLQLGQSKLNCQILSSLP